MAASIIQAAEDQTSYQLSGTSPARATVKALDAAGSLVQSADAGDDGRWALVVPVQKGRNEFTLERPRSGDGTRVGEPAGRSSRSPCPATPTPDPDAGADGPRRRRARPTRPRTAPATSAAVPPVAAGQAALAVASPQDGATQR